MFVACVYLLRGVWVLVVPDPTNLFFGGTSGSSGSIAWPDALSVQDLDGWAWPCLGAPSANVDSGPDFFTRGVWYFFWHMQGPESLEPVQSVGYPVEGSDNPPLVLYMTV